MTVLSLLTTHTQSTVAESDNAQAEVVVSKLFPPVYPAIARTAGVGGDVEVDLGIRRDGSIESSVAVSGPDLLKQAALDSAKQSTFECRGCIHEPTIYSLVYSFQLDTPDELPGNEREARVDFDPSHRRIVVKAEPAVLVAGPMMQRRVRSLKCFWLWKCSLH